MPQHESYTHSSRRLRIFLCHATVDKAAVRALYQRLQTDGFEPWLDEEDLTPGEEWEPAIRRAVRTSDVVIVCLSPHAVVEAGFRHKEIRFALDVADEQPEGTIYIIPVRLEACEVPERLSRWHWVNLHEEHGYTRLLRALNKRAQNLNTSAQPSTPTTPPTKPKERPPAHGELQPAAPPRAEPRTRPATASAPTRHKRSNTALISVTVLALVIASAFLVSREWSVQGNGSGTNVADALTATSRAASVAETSAASAAPTNTATPTIVPTDTPQPLPQESNTVAVPIGTTGQVLEMVEVPAGPFLMGSSDEDQLASDDEKPQHEVTLDTYWFGKTEVTNVQFRPFVEGDGYSNPDYWTEAGWQWREEKRITQPCLWNDTEWNVDEQPVVCISWFEAVAYTNWLSVQTGHDFRLPTEAEWEKAARGPNGRIWPWGNEWVAENCNCGNTIGKTTPVGQYPDGASPYGTLDMAGNVWEWTATKWLKEYPYQIADEWTEDYLAGDVSRAIRGGSWFSEQKFARGASRLNFSVPRLRIDSFGLRLVRHSPVEQ